jgi:hypothetical protein
VAPVFGVSDPRQALALVLAIVVLAMASDAPHKRIEFRWQRDRTTLTAESGGDRRSARYELEPRDRGCSLQFDQPFVPDARQSTYWSDVR